MVDKNIAYSINISGIAEEEVSMWLVYKARTNDRSSRFLAPISTNVAYTNILFLFLKQFSTACSTGQSKKNDHA